MASFVSMSAAEASEYAAILCLDTPVGITFGCDYMSWTTGERVGGVKLVPPGVHFIFTSASGDSRNDMAPRLGFFVHLQRGDVCVRRWSADADALLPLRADEADTEQRLAHAVRTFEFDARLAAYPRDAAHARWVALSQFIHAPVLDRVQPVQKFVFSAARSEVATASSSSSVSSSSSLAATTSSSAASPASSASLSTRLYEQLGSGTMFFTDALLAPDAVSLAGRSAADITRLHLDKTPLLARALARIARAAFSTIRKMALTSSLMSS